jgi:hypothetical protein
MHLPKTAKPATACCSEPASNIEQLGGASISLENIANLPQTSSGAALDRISTPGVL